MFCNMYLVPYFFEEPNKIKFPTNYREQFKPFKQASDVLLAYGDTLIVLRHLEGAIEELLKKHKIRYNKKTYPDNLEILIKKLSAKKIFSDHLNKNIQYFLVMRRKFLYDCFHQKHKSFMFYSEDMRLQFNYLYCLFLTLENQIRHLV